MPVYPLENILAVLLVYKALEMIMGLNIYLLQKSWLQVLYYYNSFLNL